jgi:GTP pyrophosphokinase
MVKVREHHLELENGSIDIDEWLDRLKQNYGYTNLSVLKKALMIIRRLTCHRKSYGREDSRSANELSYLTIALDLVHILASLHLDINSLIVAAFYYPINDNMLAMEDMIDHFNGSIVKLMANVHGMVAISEYYGNRNKSDHCKDQSVKIRKMLIAIIDDPRVALIKLAERCCIMRELKYYPQQLREKIANEVFEVYAPLAHRLSIGCIKWELEDLSFRYMKPQEYKRIALLLDGKRLNREQYISKVIEKLQQHLSSSGISAKVTGRVKHIYSIWRKLQKKNTEFEKLYDIRAVRITTQTIEDCYVVLSIVHSLWGYIPQEFDDYIATPKENGYRSLHTAVFGPEEKTLEIQIRTKEMHQEAELGVCSHWKYKESHYETTDNSDEKISWLRQVMKWNDEISSTENQEEKIKFVENNRTYVFTKDSHVIDLEKGSTPIDFAYKIHTDIGNRCCGAKVFGEIVPLNYVLKTGDQVEILTSNRATPSLDWLNSNLRYIYTKRAKTKVLAWLNKNSVNSHKVERAKELLIEELKKHELENIDLKQLSKKLGFNTTDNLLVAINNNKIKLKYILQVATESLSKSQKGLVSDITNNYTAIKRIYNANVSVAGEENLLTKIAGCCKPIAGDYIIGYITKNNGITIHKSSCKNIKQLKKINENRIIAVSWIPGSSNFYPADIIIESIDRPKLLHEITQVFVNNQANVIKFDYNHSKKYSSIVKLKVTIEIPSYQILNNVLSQINQIPNIVLAHKI